jgi:SulP family sulfate permease
MPALGALLILASLSTIKPAELRSIWETGWPSRAAAFVTFVATLFLPIQAAVGLGVLLSALLYVNEASTDVLVVELVKLSDGRIKEREAPRHLRSNEVTILDVYGHLFYAGARTLQRLLPAAEGVEKPVVILRLRGLARLGATLIDVLAGYANKLHDANGRLYLTGLDDADFEQAAGDRKLNAAGVVHLREASSIRGESTNQAFAEATAWLAGQERQHE